MNKYFALRKANRMRTRLLTEKSQEQLKEVIRYLRRVSWDFCGIELVRSDLLDISIQANAENQELFDSISDAKIFVEEVKPSLKTLRAADYFWFLAPLYFFFEWGVEGLLLYPVIGDWVFELSVGYLMQLVVAVTAFCALFRRMMEQVGFPPREHWLKYATWLVLYIVTLYGTGWFFTQIAGKIVLLRLPILSYSIFCLLLGAGLYAIHFWRYGRAQAPVRSDQGVLARTDEESHPASAQAQTSRRHHGAGHLRSARPTVGKEDENRIEDPWTTGSDLHAREA